MTGTREFPRYGHWRTLAECGGTLSDSPMQSSLATPDRGARHGLLNVAPGHVRKRLDAAQHWRGFKLPSIVTVPGSSTTTTDHPPLVGRTQPVEADRYRDQRTRRAY